MALRLPIPSDEFRPGDIDGSDPVAVKAGLLQTTFGYLVPDATIEVMCRHDRGCDLFGLTEESDPQFAALKEFVDPGDDWLNDVPELTDRALLILGGHVYATDEARGKVIELVKDAGIFGALAQANLTIPTKATRRWPWWCRPWRRNSSPSIMPNLFMLFGEG